MIEELQFLVLKIYSKISMTEHSWDKHIVPLHGDQNIHYIGYSGTLLFSVLGIFPSYSVRKRKFYCTIGRRMGGSK